MREERMARAFVEFSDTLVRDYDVVEFLAGCASDRSRSWRSRPRVPC